MRSVGDAWKRHYERIPKWRPILCEPGRSPSGAVVEAPSSPLHGSKPARGNQPVPLLPLSPSIGRGGPVLRREGGGMPGTWGSPALSSLADEVRGLGVRDGSLARGQQAQPAVETHEALSADEDTSGGAWSPHPAPQCQSWACGMGTSVATGSTCVTARVVVPSQRVTVPVTSSAAPRSAWRERAKTRGHITHCTFPLSSSIVTKTGRPRREDAGGRWASPPPAAPSRRGPPPRRQWAGHPEATWAARTPAGARGGRAPAPDTPPPSSRVCAVRQRGDIRRHRQGALTVAGRRDGAFGLPERPPAVGGDRVDGPRRRQRARPLRRHPRAPHQVAGAGGGPVPLSLPHDPLRRRPADRLDAPQAQPHATVGGDRLGLTPVQAGVPERHLARRASSFSVSSG